METRSSWYSVDDVLRSRSSRCTHCSRCRQDLSGDQLTPRWCSVLVSLTLVDRCRYRDDVACLEIKHWCQLLEREINRLSRVEINAGRRVLNVPPFIYFILFIMNFYCFPTAIWIFTKLFPSHLVIINIYSCTIFNIVLLIAGWFMLCPCKPIGLPMATQTIVHRFNETPTNGSRLTTAGLPWWSPIQVLTEVDVPQLQRTCIMHWAGIGCHRKPIITVYIKCWRAHLT